MLISSTYFPPQVGGIANMMAELVRSLGKARVCCFTGVRGEGYRERGFGRPNVYRRPQAFRGSKPVRAFGWGLALLEILLRERPRAVQISTVYDGYLGLWLRRKLDLPFLIYAHGNEILDVLRKPDNSRSKIALRAADRVVAVSRYTAALAQRAGALPERIEVIHPGCDANRFRPLTPTRETRKHMLGDRSDGRVLISVGNLVARKGHDVVLRALPQLLQKFSDLTYLVVGDGPHRVTLEALTNSLGVENEVVFAGQVTPHRLPEVYGLGDVFVLPSREDPAAGDVEGFGLVFLEANACGLPVIGGRSGGVPDAVEAGVTGLLVDPLDVQEIAAVIEGLLMEPDRARRMGRQGRKRVLCEFQWPKVAEAIQGVVEEMATTRGRGKSR